MGDEKKTKQNGKHYNRGRLPIKTRKEQGSSFTDGAKTRSHLRTRRAKGIRSPG